MIGCFWKRCIIIRPSTARALRQMVRRVEEFERSSKTAVFKQCIFEMLFSRSIYRPLVRMFDSTVMRAPMFHRILQCKLRMST